MKQDLKHLRNELTDLLAAYIDIIESGDKYDHDKMIEILYRAGYTDKDGWFIYDDDEKE